MKMRRLSIGPIGGAIGGALLLCGACGSPPVDTSPSVSISSPVMNMHLPMGKTISVSFVIDGFDPNSPADAQGNRPKFKLAEGSTLMPGVGKLVAYYNGSNSVATTTKQFEPLSIPGPETGIAPANLILPGSGDITLRLFYNNDTPVDPSRSAEVKVIIDP